MLARRRSLSPFNADSDRNIQKALTPRPRTSEMLPDMRQFIRTSLVYAAAAFGTAQAATAVTTTNANLRHSPSAAASVVRVVPRGTLLVVACQGSWCRSSYQGRGGYMARSLLKPVSRSAALSGPGVRFYRSCAAVRAAGKAPLRLGQPGFRTALDRNHNGVACESGER